MALNFQQAKQFFTDQNKKFSVMINKSKTTRPIKSSFPDNLLHGTHVILKKRKCQ